MSRRALRRYLSIVAMLLSVVMLILSTPLGVFAEGVEILEEDTVLSDDQQQATEESQGDTLTYESMGFVSDELIGNVIEVTDRREENVKHFALSDGTFEAVVYSKPVHRMDEGGVWQDIDNNLSLNTNRYSTSDGRVSFSNSTPSLTLSENGYTVVMEYTEIPAQSGNISASQTVFASSVTNAPDRAETFESLDEARQIDNKSSITYTTQNRASIEYILDGNDVKENIIISERSDSYEYIFTLTLSGLTATLNDNGDILLCDGEETKYVIPAPFMYDADGNISYDVDYELIQVKDSLYLIRITADSTWINADGRSFPVTVDPTISSESIMVLDAHVSSTAPNTNYHDSTYLEVGSGRISYIYVEPPSLPPDITVNTATFNVNYYYGGYEGNMTVGAHAVSEMWAENEITYNQRPAYESTPISTVSMTVYREYSEYSALQASVSIKPMVTNWITQSSTSGYNGLALVYQSGSIEYINLVSSESSVDMGAFISINYSYDLIDGVYAFKNLGATNRWMTTELAAGAYYPEIGANLQQKYSSTSPTDGELSEESTRASLFKITKVAEATESEGARYVIRSMLDNSISFGVSGTEIVAKTIPYDDADVAIADTFYIEPYNSRYFYIRPYGSTKVINVTNTSTVDLATIEKTSASTKARWEIYRYTRGHADGYVRSTPAGWQDTGIPVNSTGTVMAKGVWSTYANGNTSILDIPTEYEDMGTVASSSTSDSIIFTANKLGTVKFDYSVLDGNGTVLKTRTFTMQIIPIEGTYYLQNVESENYMDIGAYSDTPGTSVEQSAYSDDIGLKWNIEHVEGSGGYVLIKSVYSDFYLAIDSTNTTSVIEAAGSSSSYNDYYLWKINRSSEGNLILVCKATESSGKALAVPTASSANGTDLTQSVYAEDSNFGDEWFLYGVNNRLNIVITMDNGYVERFTHEGAVSRINSIMSEVKNYYAREFFICINVTALQKIRYNADECSLKYNEICDSSAENATCPCFSSVDTHHKRINNILNNMDKPNISQTASILFSGHITCYIYNSTHYAEECYGLSEKASGRAVVAIGGAIDAVTSDEMVLLAETNTTIHEIGHWFNTVDHNRTGETEELNNQVAGELYNDLCIYGRYKVNTSAFTKHKMCQGCIKTVRENATYFSH